MWKLRRSWGYIALATRLGACASLSTVRALTVLRFVYSFNFSDTIVIKDRAWASPFYFLMGIYISALGLISCTALFWSESAARFNLNRQSRPIQSNAESEDRTARLYSLRIHGIWFISTSFSVLLTKSHCKQHAFHICILLIPCRAPRYTLASLGCQKHGPGTPQHLRLVQAPPHPDRLVYGHHVREANRGMAFRYSDPRRLPEC